MMRLVSVVLVVFGLALGAARDSGGSKARTLRVPDGGIQPQVAVDAKGTLHMVYFKGEARQGDVFYVRSSDGGATFSAPLRVNSVDGSAVAAGTIRGAQMALGSGGRVHVAWNGSMAAAPKGAGHHASPMLYSRLNDKGTAFEPQRNLMQRTTVLDGGGTLAADASGNVYVIWHATTHDTPKGEAGRRVWVARSTDSGKTFAAETPAWEEATGACACCGMGAFTDRKGTVYTLYRSAMENVNRDIYLLMSKDRGASFQGTLLHKWEINACPMSSMSFVEAPQGVLGAWETRGQVYFGRIDTPEARTRPIGAPGEGRNRKHPRLAANARGETILAWTEGTGWQKAGALVWQVFDKEGKPVGESGRVAEIPVWSFGAVFAGPDGAFTVVY